MNPRFQALVLIVFLVACFTAACRGPEPAGTEQPPAVSSEPKAPEPQAAAPATSGTTDQVATGTLQNVDLTARKLVIKNATGNEETFSFTDSTEITGVAGTQGLSSKKGGQVIVHYVAQPDGGRMAMKIEIASN